MFAWTWLYHPRFVGKMKPMRIVWNCNIISSGTLYNQSFLIECKLYSYLIGTTWYVSTFFRTFQFPKKSSPGVFGIAEYGSDISFLKFSTLGPLGLKVSKKNFFQKISEKPHLWLRAYFLLNFSAPLAPNFFKNWKFRKKCGDISW